ncbi:hypothetical protein [Stakelama pacifica]|uniref:Uncharacterized protein n=1 Tax=Stakelama pacifica TaxID=517720 RepID=A0A4R6FBK7_9SPHN|nr:hypothetical protein [Stakelama pacifica]TDN78561.1 hypothetical protein EV664_1164 [Stakelama pacifica]GGO99266.1 hypothetical protein GCM10011329_32350 [Stakelama pacifica]
MQAVSGISPSRFGGLFRLPLLCVGVLLVIISPIVGAIPGPGGIFVFAAGLVLVLQNSQMARKHFVRAKRRWPRVGDLVDRALRRRSAQRRRKREKRAAR